MTSIQIKPHLLKGSIQIPPSKSIAHRAIICASLARGRSIIRNIEYSKDIEATIEAMKELGTIIFQHDDYLEIDGTTTFFRNKLRIDCHESGSTLRFMIPLTLVYDANVHFYGEGRLGKRPLDVYYRIFDKQKENLIYLYRENALDLYLQGHLHGGTFEIPGNVSSQFLTGLLFALPLMQEDSVIKVTTPLESLFYIDLTLQVLRLYGIQIINHNYREFVIQGQQSYQPCDYDVEGDFSQAAFFLAAGALGNDVVCHGLNLDTKQGDYAMIVLLKQMNCQFVEKDNGYQIISQKLRPLSIDGSQFPDIIPILALVCALADGTSEIMNIGRLRLKESDRLKATVEVINQLGGQAIEKEDAMIIHGVKKLKGGQVSSYNDHRMAMMEAIASTVCQNDVMIDDKDCVQKSYPSFWEDFESLGGDYRECIVGNSD